MSTWYLRNVNRRPAPLRLFCFPYAGGSAVLFRDWIDLLAPRIEVMAVELPGHGSRRDEIPFTALNALVEALTAAVLPDLNKPFAIFGHSMGALVGYEFARQVYTRVGLQPRRLFVSGHGAPRNKSPSAFVHDLPAVEFIAELRRLNGTPREFLEDAELMNLALPLLRADFRLDETHIHRPFPLLTCPISAYGGREDPEVSADALSAWRNMTKGAFSERIFAGDHFFIHTAATLLTQQIELDLT